MCAHARCSIIISFTTAHGWSPLQYVNCAHVHHEPQGHSQETCFLSLLSTLRNHARDVVIVTHQFNRYTFNRSGSFKSVKINWTFYCPLISVAAYFYEVLLSPFLQQFYCHCSAGGRGYTHTFTLTIYLYSCVFIYFYFHSETDIKRIQMI